MATLAVPSLAFAAQAAPAAGPPAAVGGVVVTTESAGVRMSIDRRSYGVASDLQTTTGSITDALRNIPSVQVDVQGAVSLRGDTNVTILIDGKPSALFRGDGAAQALEQLAADQIERVEVVTNPSAAFSPDGSAGVINLVTRQTFRAGYTGSLRTNVGTEGRRNANLAASYQDGRLTVSGNASVRRDESKSQLIDERSRRQAADGPSSESRQRTTSYSLTRVASGRFGIDYDPDARTRLGAELSYQRVRSDNTSHDHQEQAGADGALTRMIDRFSAIAPGRDNLEAEATFRRRFAGDEHELTARLSREWSNEDRIRRVTSSSRLPHQPDAVEAFDYEGALRQTNVRLDYTRPMAGDARLKLGYALDADDNHYDNLGRRGVAFDALSVDPALTYVFDYSQTIHAVYGAYQRPFGDLTVLAGLRMEHADVDVALRNPAQAADNSYFKAFPSLHLSYVLSEAQQLTTSFSQRVRRPRPNDLNPFRVYDDPFNYRQGNPDLKPQQTRSYELGYQYRKSGVFYLATLYYRQNSGGVSDVVRDVGGGVFVTTRENLRESRSGGLELVANGRLNKAVTYNVSSNAFWDQIDASTLGFAKPRSTYSLSGRANLNWQIDANDFLQLNGFANGKRLTAQGYSAGYVMLNLGYRHKFTDKLTGVLTAQDLLGTFRQRQVFDSPLLSGAARRESNRRAVFIGFTYTFGTQRQQRDAGFEFGDEAAAE